jgi:hypothetical protein
MPAETFVEFANSRAPWSDHDEDRDLLVVAFPACRDEMRAGFFSILRMCRRRSDRFAGSQMKQQPLSRNVVESGSLLEDAPGSPARGLAA